MYGTWRKARSACAGLVCGGGCGLAASGLRYFSAAGLLGGRAELAVDLCSERGEGVAVEAGRAVIPGAREGDRPEHRIDDLVPVGDEPCLMALAARHPRAAVAGIGGQQPSQHAAARVQHPGADHRLGSLHARAAAAQRPGRLGGQPPYLGGLLPRERIAEPPFSSSGAEGASVPAAGLASQIFSFASAIRSLIAANCACRATSQRTFSTSPGQPAAGRQSTRIDPETWAAPLTEELAAAEAPADAELLAAAHAVLMLTDKADQKPTKYHAEIENSQGVYVGDGGTQTNYFGNPARPTWPARSGHRRLGMARGADTKGKPLK